ncbi:MAG: ABC transporter substrate-binding protein [Microthrixaceae bacterium]
MHTRRALGDPSPDPGGPHRGRAWSAGVALVLVTLLAAGCTTSDGDADGDDGGDTTTSSAVPTTEAGTEATGEPIKLGWVNTDTGATAIPVLSEGAQVAVDRLNAHGGGIGGRPIELVTCATDGTPESSAKCANDMVAEGVVAVVEGGDLGSDAKIPILRDAGIATLGASTLGTGQSLNPEAFFFAPPATTYPAVEVDLAKEIGATNLTLLVPDVPQVPIVADIGEEQAALQGLTFQVVTFDPAAPDFDAALATIATNGSDAIATIATEDWCAGMLSAAQSSGFQGDMIMGTCAGTTEDIAATAAGEIYALSSVWSPRSRDAAPPEAQVAIDEYLAAMDEADLGEEATGQAYAGYISVTQAAWALSTIQGELTAETVMAGLRTLKDAPNPIGQPITCDPRPYPGFSGCAEGWLMLATDAEGISTPISDGFVAPAT